jgi:hypothetical protein
MAERFDLTECERAVLGVLIQHSDGAGFCWVKVTTIVLEGGCSRRSVFRALASLEAARLIARFDHRAPRQAATTYRLGRALRDSAGLVEVNEVEALGLEFPPLAGTPRDDDRSNPRPKVELAPLVGTPQVSTTSLQSEGCQGLLRGTPRTKNEEQAGNGAKEPTSDVDPAAESTHPTLDDTLRDEAALAAHLAPYTSRCAVCDDQPGLLTANFHGARLTVCFECRDTWTPIARAVKAAL